MAITEFTREKLPIWSTYLGILEDAFNLNFSRRLFRSTLQP